MMKTRISAFMAGLLATTLVSAGCLDHDFCTFATYEAPKTGCRVSVFSSGVVKAGRDLSEGSDGTAWVCPTSGTSGKGVELSIARMEKVRYKVAGGPGGVLAWTWNDFPETLDTVFEKAGYAERDEAELLEIGKAISGVLSGPKGTILEGQSRILNVLETDYHYGRCTDGMESKAAEKPRSCGAFR